MRTFGDVTRVFFAPNDRQYTHSIAYVDYRKFAEAERAIRELNSAKNSGLDFKAELAQGPRKSETAMPKTQDSQNNLQPQEASYDHNHVSLIDFSKNFTPNENREKVTQFEFQPSSKNVSENYQKLKQLAEESKWIYSDNFQRAEFSPNLRRNLFLEFLCCRCNGIAVMRDDASKKYYCSLACVQSTAENQNNFDFTLKKSDKVSIVSIMNEKCIFIRLTQDDLNYLLEKIYRVAKANMIPVEMTPDIGEKVLAKVYDGIYRAKVLEIAENECNEVEVVIQLTDIGCTTSVTVEVSSFNLIFTFILKSFYILETL